MEDQSRTCNQDLSERSWRGRPTFVVRVHVRRRAMERQIEIDGGKPQAKETKRKSVYRTKD